MSEKKLTANKIWNTVKGGNNLNILVLIVVILVFYFYNNSFLGAFNTKSMLTTIAALLIMACGVTYVITLGSIDLSMGAVCDVGSVMLVTYIHQLGWAIFPIILAFGALTGILLGFIHVKFKIPSFIASLGMMSVYQSIALWICPASTRVKTDDMMFIKWGQVSVFNLFTVIFILAVVIMVVMYLVQKYTYFGKNLNMVGSNERAARLAGCKIDRIKISAFTVCGMTSALAGIILAIKLSSADSEVGDPFTLMAVASVLLGGNTMMGGRGNILKTLIGVVMVVVIQNGMGIMGVGAWWNNIIFGIVIVIAMILTTDKSRDLIVK